MTDPRPTKTELRELGIELMRTLQPVMEKHDGIRVVIAYSLPRADPGIHGMSIACNELEPTLILQMLVHGARDVKEQMIDPFYFDLNNK